MNVAIVFRPIGVIRSQHVVPQETPIQPVYAKECRGHVELLPEFAEGLHDLTDAEGKAVPPEPTRERKGLENKEKAATAKDASEEAA